MRSIELSGAGVNRPGFDPACEIIHRQPASSERCWIRFDPDRGLDTIDVHLRDAGQNGHALGHYG